MMDLFNLPFLSTLLEFGVDTGSTVCTMAVNFIVLSWSEVTGTIGIALEEEEKLRPFLRTLLEVGACQFMTELSFASC